MAGRQPGTLARRDVLKAAAPNRFAGPMDFAGFCLWQAGKCRHALTGEAHLIVSARNAFDCRSCANHPKFLAARQRAKRADMRLRTKNIRIIATIIAATPGWRHNPTAPCSSASMRLRDQMIGESGCSPGCPAAGVPGTETMAKVGECGRWPGGAGPLSGGWNGPANRRSGRRRVVSTRAARIARQPDLRHLLRGEEVREPGSTRRVERLQFAGNVEPGDRAVLADGGVLVDDFLRRLPHRGSRDEVLEGPYFWSHTAGAGRRSGSRGRSQWVKSDTTATYHFNRWGPSRGAKSRRLARWRATPPPPPRATAGVPISPSAPNTKRLSPKSSFTTSLADAARRGQWKGVIQLPSTQRSSVRFPRLRDSPRHAWHLQLWESR